MATTDFVVDALLEDDTEDETKPEDERALRPLTPKRALFVKHYIGAAKFVGARAAVMAGFPEKSARIVASELLTFPNVKAAIHAALKKRAEKSEVVALKLREQAEEVVQRCLQHAPVLDEDGNPIVGEGPDGEVGALYKFDPRAAINAMTFRAKLDGLLTEKVEHSGEITLSALIDRIQPALEMAPEEGGEVIDVEAEYVPDAQDGPEAGQDGAQGDDTASGTLRETQEG